MNLDPSYMIEIDDGRLMSSREDLTKIFTTAVKSGKPIVMHFHGGLVGRSSAIDAASNNKIFYESFGAYPVFPIWRTGFLETLSDVWIKIASEQLFRMLIDRVSGWVHSQILNATVGGRAGVPKRTLPPVTIEIMLESGNHDGDFTASFLQNLNLKDLKNSDIGLTPIEEKGIMSSLAKDIELKLEVDAILAGADLTLSSDTRDLEGIAPQPAKKSFADRAVLTQIAGDANTRSIGFGTAVKVLSIIKKVLQRFIEGRDHGLHATVVEEVLRAFYIGSIGTTIWNDMKNDAASAFQNDAGWAGTAILNEIEKVPATQRIMLVGHSAGAIFISELMKSARSNMRPIEIVFLAPAVRAKLFVESIVQNVNPVVAKFRMYTMSDENECRDTLIRNLPVLGDLPWFYPRSLLYFISGLLEGDEVDADVLGLQRFHKTDCWNANDQFLSIARDFCASVDHRTCWSIANDQDEKLRTNSLSHGGFGTGSNTNTTMISVGKILSTGW